MLNTEIKYKTSTDYKELYRLLKEGYVLIGFIAIDVNGVPNMKYSKLVQMSYNSNIQAFDLGFSFFESDFDKIGFEQLCLKSNLQFIPLNEVQNTTNVGNEVLADISSRFLSAKFGKNMVLNFDGHEDSQYEGRRVGGKLQELLDEFAQIVTAVELVELQNPRTKEFTLVDKNKGTIIGSYDKSFLNGC